MTGAGSDNIEFDIQTSRSLSILSNTGDGQAKTKIHRQVLPTTATVTSRLTLNSGNGPTKTVMGFVGEAENNIFAWNMRGVSGNKVIDGIADFKAGGATATSSVNFNLGTGAHVANLAVDSEVPVATMNVATGPNVAESITSIIADDPSSALNVVHTSRSPKSVLNVVSAAVNLDVDLIGDHLSAQNDVSHSINQIRPGTVSVFYDLNLADGAA